MSTSAWCSYLFAVVAVAACAKPQTTAPGHLGDVDLAARQPENVAKGADDPTSQYERTAEVCARDRAAGVRLVVRWETFAKGENRYIAKYGVELAKPTEGVSVELGAPGPVGNANRDPAAPFLGTATIVVKCTTDGTTVQGNVVIRADGNAS